MYLEVLAASLSQLHDSQALFMRLEPEILDFTQLSTAQLLVYGKNSLVTVPLKEDLNLIVAMLKLVCHQEKIIISWNIKNLISYLKFHANFDEFEAKIVDLKLAEAFLGQEKEPPQSLGNALQRISAIKDNSKWRTFYKIIHQPLALEVIPQIENTGVLHTQLRQMVYPYYEIEGQANGRLRCLKAFDHCINPHTLTLEQKSYLKTIEEDEIFLSLDFKNMEVSMLYWLTQDEQLENIFVSEKDVYLSIYKLLGGTKESAANRQFIKELFLPVVYGMQATALMEKNAHLSLIAAQNLILKIETVFKKAFTWITERQQLGIVEDCLGRQRIFTEKPWTVRNFLVQSPAAAVCLEKLIKLHKTLGSAARIVFNIHDGYVLITHKKIIEEISMVAQETLESPSALCPGLNLKIAKKVGTDKLSAYNNDS